MAIAPALMMLGPAGWIALGAIAGITVLVFVAAAASNIAHEATSNAGREQSFESIVATDSKGGASAGSETGSQSGGGAGGTADVPWEDGTVKDTPPPGWVKSNPDKDDSNNVHPDYQGVSIDPELEHGPPDGPHWDFHIRILPRKIKVPIGDKWPDIKLR